MTKHESKQFPVALYARVSTSRQDTEAQMKELRDFVARSGWTVFKEYIDEGFSGKNTKRPAFNDMMNHAKERKFKALVVWKLDRLSRSLKDLVVTIEEFDSLGIDFVSYNDHIDTTTPQGKFMFQMIGVVAEFEREIIRERVKMGIRNARSKGKPHGRPPLTNLQLEQAKELREQGLSYRKIAEKLGVNYSTLAKKKLGSNKQLFWRGS